jgi:hypothetical protein
MCEAPASVPKRELRTPVARKSWNVSAGTRAKSRRKGIATFTLPNRLTTPAAARRGYSAGVSVVSEYHAAKRTKLNESILAEWGKL